jgi:methylglutaconyl-CoA hydratase
VEELPFLAGSVVPFSKDQPWLHDLRPHGAAYLEVKDLSQEINFLDLRKARFSSSLLDAKQICPFPAPVYIQDGPLDVCRLRANFVDGGLLLVLSIIHTVCDGRGITEVIKIFADKLRKAQTGELVSRSTGHEDLPKQVYSFDRTSVLSGNGIPGAIENHPGWTALPLPFLGGSPGIKTSCTNFHITCDALRALKEVTSSSSSGSRASAAVNALHPLEGKYTSSSQQATSISTNDAIAALIWRSIMLARYRAGIISERTITHFSQAVDCRSRLHLPEPYFGNAIYGVKASLALHRLALATDNSDASQFLGLQAAGRAIRAEINGATADKFRDLLGFVDRTDMQLLTRLSVLEDLLIGSMLLVSYINFEMHDIDFGEAFGGKIESFRLPSQGLIPGMPVVLPRLPDGSCEFVINEQENVVNFLAKDEIFQKFASKYC